MSRKHHQEVPSCSSSVSTSLTWDRDSTRPVEFLLGMGVPAVKRDKLDDKSVPEELVMSSPSPPPKRQKVSENEEDSPPKSSSEMLEEPEPGYCWNTLPDELLLVIFTYLPLRDLIKVSQTCKRWHCISFDESLWQSLDLSGGNLLPGVIGQLLPAGVTVFRCPRARIGEPLFKTTNPLRVQYMDLSNCTVSVSSLQSILCLCESLKNLSLEGLVLSDDIVKSIAKNSNLLRLNLSGCSGFSANALEYMLKSCDKLDELNLSWCDFTATHVKTAVNHVNSRITQLNLSGYRQNLQIADIETLVERCPFIVHLDLSDSVMLKSACFQYFHHLFFLKHLCLSRCYKISPSELVQLGGISTLQTLQVFGLMTENSVQLLRDMLPHIKINCSHFTTIARPTVSNAKNQEIWGIKCRLRLIKPRSNL